MLAKKGLATASFKLKRASAWDFGAKNQREPKQFGVRTKNTEVKTNMQYRKIAAVAGSALMGSLTLAGAALAATNAGDILKTAVPTSAGAVQFPLVVIGAKAASSDVSGAVDIAVRLAAESKTSVAVTTTGATGVDGISRDGVSIGVSSGGTGLATAITGGAALPTGALIKNAHYSKLKDTSFSWKGNDYTYREQLDLSGARMRHDL